MSVVVPLHNVSMRVVGYMRAVPGVEGGRLYAQGEAIREWARRSNASIVAYFQDDDGVVAGPGLRALMRSVGTDIDAVIVSDASILAADSIGQEIIRARFRAAGIGVASADGAMEADTDGALRQVVRDILARKQDLDDLLAASAAEPRAPSGGLILEIVPDAANG